jgi:hypothetical protein
MNPITIQPAQIDIDNSTGTYVGVFPPTMLPIGKFVCEPQYLPGYCHVRGGSTILYPQQAYSLNFQDAYDIKVSNIKFIGGAGAIYFSNHNINGANIVIENCEFHGQQQAIQCGNYPLSTKLTMRNCKFFGTQLLNTGCDQTLIENCWIQTLPQIKTEVIKNNYGNLYVKNCILVPDDSHPESYWIYNKGNVFADGNRFGGEFGGMPIIKHDALVDTKYPYMGPIISLTNNQLSSGQSKNPNRGIVTIMQHRPRMLTIKGNHYIVDTKFINNKSTVKSPSICVSYIQDNATWGAN